MERYTMIKEVGNGTYGSVWKALCKHSGEVVAIKKMKKYYHSWEECLNLSEVKVLRKLNHPNIIKLKEVIRENSVLYFVFEYMEHDVFHIMKTRGCPFSEAEVRNLVFQVFQGLAYLHKHGYFHRDLKPENFLVSTDHLKIADFGLAREFDSQPPFTQYVATRWYRAPEIMLQSPEYGPPADMWAMGAIMAEFFTFQPLFPGASEGDQLYQICRVLGSPTSDTWPEGRDLASAINYQFPQATGMCLSSLIPSASKDAINLIASLCSWDPLKRPRAIEALQYPFFQSCFYIPASLHSKPVFTNTPPITVGGLEILSEESERSFPVFLLKPPCFTSLSSTKEYAPLISGVQRKLDLDNYYVNPNDKSQNFMKQQLQFYPPGMDENPDDYPGIVAPGVVDAAAKRLEKLMMGTGELSPKLPVLPPINAGGWDKQPDLFNQQRKELLAGRAHDGKAVVRELGIRFMMSPLPSLELGLER